MRRPNDNKPATQPSPEAEATHDEASALLVTGTTYTGKVVAYDGKTYSVALDAGSNAIPCLPVSAVLGGLLGFNLRTRIQLGTQVSVCFIPNSSLITSIIVPPQREASSDRQMLTDADVSRSDNTAADLLEGEFEISNLFGVSLEMLTTLCRLGAGERARIEFAVIPEMMRMITHRFQHISGIGNELIFDDGRPSLERYWSSYRHELMNLLSKSEQLPKQQDGVSDAELLRNRVTATGRFRLVELMGFVGDFLHSFICDPATVKGYVLAEGGGAADGDDEPADGATGEQKPGAGKSWIHRNSDGTLIIQSVADIRLERVCRIPLPLRIRKDDDVAVRREYEDLNASYLKLQADFGSYADKTAYRMAYQIRTYSRWLSRYHAFARLLQLSEGSTPEFAMVAESDAEIPDWNSGEEDRQRSNADVVYYDAYATMSIMRDGSIVMHDGYGSSLCMSNGNVIVSAARHIDMEAAGDIRMVSGGSVIIKARKHVDIECAHGGFSLTARTWIKTLCERGSLWIRSNANPEAPATLQPERDDIGDPAAEIATTASVTDLDGPHPLEHQTAAHVLAGVIVETPHAKTVLRSGPGLTVVVDDTPRDNETVSTADYKRLASKDAQIAFHTRGNVRMDCRSVLWSVAENWLLNVRGGIALRVAKLYGSVMDLRLNKKLKLSGSQLTLVGSMRASSVEANSMATVTRGVMQASEHVGAHRGHVAELAPYLQVTSDAATAGSDTTMDAAVMYLDTPAMTTDQRPWPSALNGPLWRTYTKGSAEFHWDVREETTGCLVESLTQQFIREGDAAELGDGDDVWNGKGYATWEWTPKRSDGVRMPAELASFGVGTTVMRAVGGDSLHKPCATNPAEIRMDSSQWEASSRNIQFKFLKP